MAKTKIDISNLPTSNRNTQHDPFKFQARKNTEITSNLPIVTGQTTKNPFHKSENAPKQKLGTVEKIHTHTKIEIK